MTELCKAAWSSGKCNREPGAARGLCQGHYAQWRRQTDSGKLEVRVAFTELRERGGDGNGTLPVTIHLHPDTAEAYKRAAKDSGQSASELMGTWCALGFKRHQARAEMRRLLNPSG